MTEPAIRLDGVGKRYERLSERAGLRSLLPGSSATRSDFWALEPLNLAIEPGETVGILGRNGSGKTTLLRMLCGITAPTVGRLRVVGRIAPLIGVGVGFNPEMSGRDNVFINGLLLGLTREQIEDRFDQIVAFAELEDFLDNPVKFYSSGMFVRLGFAIAVHSDPEVLIVDEVLAVGDVSYQIKCIDRMQQLQAGGCTVVFVSHAVATVRVLCPRALLLNDGKLAFDGPSDEAVDQYHRILSKHDEREAVRSGLARPVTGGAAIVHHELFGSNGPRSSFEPGDPIWYRFTVRFDRRVDDPLFGITVIDADGRAAYGVHSPIGHRHRTYEAGEEAFVEVRLVNRLVGGTYRVRAAVTSADARETLADQASADLFFVPAMAHTYGSAALDGVVAVDGVDLVEQRTFRIGDAPAAGLDR